MNHILVVEDNALLGKFYGEVLVDMGLEVTRVTTRTAALEWLKHEVPQLVLLDIGLPDGNGQTIIDYMKSVRELSTVPIVVISGQNDYKNEKLMSMVDKFQPKPISMWALREMAQEFGLVAAPEY